MNLVDQVNVNLKDAKGKIDGKIVTFTFPEGTDKVEAKLRAIALGCVMIAATLEIILKNIGDVVAARWTRANGWNNPAPDSRTAIRSVTIKFAELPDPAKTVFGLARTGATKPIRVIDLPTKGPERALMVDPVEWVRVEHTCDAGETVFFLVPHTSFSWDGIRVLGSWNEFKLLSQRGIMYNNRMSDITGRVGPGFDVRRKLFPMTEEMEEMMTKAFLSAGRFKGLVKAPPWDAPGGKFTLGWYQVWQSARWPVGDATCGVGWYKMWTYTNQDKSRLVGMWTKGAGKRLQPPQYAHSDYPAFIDYCAMTFLADARVRVISPVGPSDYVAIKTRVRSDAHFGGPFVGPDIDVEKAK
jgi:hypothetical protein